MKRMIIQRTLVKRSLWNLLPLLLVIACLGFGCGEHRITSVEDTEVCYVQPQGGEETFELATWNLKYFPHATSTVEELAKIIAALDIDLYAIQEINDTTAFRDLLNRLPDYDGLYSWDHYSWGYLKTGLIYKRAVVSLSHTRQIFEDDWYAFTRPPLEVLVVAQRAGQRFDFMLIVVHLKAGSEPDDQTRRQEANQKLKSYLDGEIDANGEKDYIVAGDWNDQLDDPPWDNVFTVFLDHPERYQFLTSDLAGQPSAASYPRYGTLIDHILISQDAFSEYHGGQIKTLRLDEEISNYEIKISDHRPVMAVFPVFEK